MRFSSLTRAVDLTATTCSLQTQAGAPAGQAAQSAVQRSPPSVTHIMGYYSFNRPWRDGRLSWPCWLTDSGRRTHKVVKQPSISLAQDKESPPARTDVLTTMIRHQLSYEIIWGRPPPGRGSCHEQPACRMEKTERTSSWYMVEDRVPGRPALQHRRSLGLASRCRSPAVASSRRHRYAPIGVCQLGGGRTSWIWGAGSR